MIRVGFIHTTRVVIEPIHNVVTSKLPNIDLVHFLDESILITLKQYKGINDEIITRVREMAKSAERAQCNTIVVTCSSISPCVGKMRKIVSIPIIKIDEPMIKWAVTNFNKIGIVMTNPTTLIPSIELVEEVSTQLGKSIKIKNRICKNAFKKLKNGDIEGHDKEVIRAVEKLLNEDAEVVLLAQVSISRVLRKINIGTRKRVFSSIDFIVDEIRKKLNI